MSKPRGSNGAALLDGVGVNSLTRYSDSSGDASETLHDDGKALAPPVTLVIDNDGGGKWNSTEAQALMAALKGG